MPWVPGVPIDHGADADRPQSVRAVTLHRTIGTWPGDYSVGKSRRHSSPGTFNLLVGQAQGQHVQFYPSDTRCSHAAGSNNAGPGIEFSGQNGEVLTAWQIEAGGHIIRSLSQMHGIPLTLHDQPRIAVDGSGYRGFVNHRGVATSPQYEHHDYVTADEFARMIGGAAPAPVPIIGEDPMNGITRTETLVGGKTFTNDFWVGDDGKARQDAHISGSGPGTGYQFRSKVLFPTVTFQPNADVYAKSVGQTVVFAAVTESNDRFQRNYTYGTPDWVAG